MPFKLLSILKTLSSWNPLCYKTIEFCSAEFVMLNDIEHFLTQELKIRTIKITILACNVHIY